MNLKAMYERQAQLQVIGKKQGHKEYSYDDLRLAVFDELGEVTHVLKPLWCWWSKPGLVKEVDVDKLLDELADVAHFLLIDDLQTGGESKLANFPYSPITNSSMLKKRWLEITYHTMRDLPITAIFIESIAPLLNYFDKTVDDLETAYFAKTDENLRRWAEANGTTQDI